ncbi:MULTISPECIES: hypothetical protein [Methylosinus]|uniref:hypothetical protein n=1 Tax=Methylosinus sp. 3S-1 TaxID=1849840 RepID=UPI001FCBBF61|nr:MULTISPECIES: hypothetical protein [Methylosinus]
MPRHPFDSCVLEQTHIVFEPASQPLFVFGNVQDEIEDGVSSDALYYFNIESRYFGVFKTDIVKYERHSEKRIDPECANLWAQRLDEPLEG